MVDQVQDDQEVSQDDLDLDEVLEVVHDDLDLVVLLDLQVVDDQEVNELQEVDNKKYFTIL
ncbi:MAG: hypothetical protein Q8S84_00455 [bacterium]|nr:hypothetical protein [bacterium]MDP3380060.1 hypothetical protein [bacterium]